MQTRRRPRSLPQVPPVDVVRQHRLGRCWSLPPSPLLSDGYSRIERSATAAPVVPQGELIMDKDRIQVSVKQVVGSVKEVVGKVLGDQKTKADGKAEKAAGKIQNAVGSIKDTVRETVKK
jgi:uncharacterized protein YjbJ (UPF0337 family)